MATQNFVITYPDAQATRIMNALKDAAKTEQNPTPSNAQALAWFNESIRNSLRDVVHRFERETAVQAAITTVIPPDVT